MNSTASSALNAMALVSLEDVVKKKVPDITDSDAAKLCKIIGQSFTVLFSSSFWDMLIYVYMISWIICIRYGWFFLMICWGTETNIMSPWTTFCLLIMYNKWIPCCRASPQKFITDDVKMGNEHQWHTRLRLVSLLLYSQLMSSVIFYWTYVRQHGIYFS